MRVLPPTWHITGAAAREPKINSYKLVGLLIGTALTTLLWMTVLVFGLHVVGIHPSGLLIASVGIVVAGLSAVALALTMVAR
jgi:hypothetical protein